MSRIRHTFRSTQTQQGMRTDIVYAEKRVALRKSLQVGVALNQDGAPAVRGRSLDISVSGMSVMLEQPIKPGQLWQIRFDLMVDGRIYRIEAVGEMVQRVIVSDGIRTGFHFKRLNMQSMILISRFVNEKAK